MKQNQQLYRPFPGENPITKPSHKLCLNSNCKCSVCKNDYQPLNPQVKIDLELQQLKKIGYKDSPRSDFVFFLDELSKGTGKSFLNFPILDTIIFSTEGSVRNLVYHEGHKLKMGKFPVVLKSFIFERKWKCDLQYQKKKYQREHPGFHFTQLDHQSQKLIKQFENNVKFMNALLNRVVIVKMRSKQIEETISQYELSNIFSRVSRKIYDFSDFEYMKIFPVMCGEEQNSYVKKIKFFYEKEKEKKNYKLAQYYISYWLNKNQTMQKMQEEFLAELKKNEDEYLMYLTYKIFIYFSKVANKEIQSAIISYITNDFGVSFFFSNIQSIKINNLFEINEKINKYPEKLVDCDVEKYISLKTEMKKTFDQFQFQYKRLQTERLNMEHKLERDIQFSNQVYESATGNQLRKSEKGENISFIDQAFQSSNSNEITLLKSSQVSKKFSGSK